MKKNIPYMVLDITKRPSDPNAVMTGDMILAENTKLRKSCIACIKRINNTLPQTDSAIVLTGLVNHIKETLQKALSTPPHKEGGAK